MGGSGEEINLTRFTEQFFPGEDPGRFKDAWQIWGEDLLLLMNILGPRRRQVVMDDLVQRAMEVKNLDIIKKTKLVRKMLEEIKQLKERLDKLQVELHQEVDRSLGSQTGHLPYHEPTEGILSDGCAYPTSQAPGPSVRRLDSCSVGSQLMNSPNQLAEPSHTSLLTSPRQEVVSPAARSSTSGSRFQIVVGFLVSGRVVLINTSAPHERWPSSTPSEHLSQVGPLALRPYLMPSESVGPSRLSDIPPPIWPPTGLEAGPTLAEPSRPHSTYPEFVTGLAGTVQCPEEQSRKKRRHD